MELTVQERLVIQGLFGREGDIVYLRAIRDINDKVGMSADELEKFKVEKIEENGEAHLRWNLDVPQEAEVELTGGEKALIVEALNKLNEEKKLLPEHLSLYDKFVEE